jgi:hypothetical protein
MPLLHSRYHLRRFIWQNLTKIFRAVLQQIAILFSEPRFLELEPGHIERDGISKTIFFFAIRETVGKPEGKIPLGRPRRRWVDNIKIDLR